jgi:general secretion pathway protein D
MNRFAAPIQLCKSTVSLLLCCTLFTGTLPAHAYKGDSAHKLFVEGQSAEAREDYDGAYEDYKKAYAKAPNDLRMRTAYYRLRQTASSTHVTTGRKLLEADKAISPPTAQAALAQFMRATEIDPGNEAALQEIAKLRSHETGIPLRSETSLSEPAQEAIEDAGSPAELKAVSNEPLTLRMTQDSKIIYQAIGKAAGINVLFDPDYNGKNISVELNNVTLMDALRIVGTLSNTFWRPVTSNTIFQAHRARRAGRPDLLPLQCMAAERPQRRPDRAAQRHGQRQGLRRAQPERHRRPRHSRRAHPGPEDHQRPRQSPPRSRRRRRHHGSR